MVFSSVEVKLQKQESTNQDRPKKSLFDCMTADSIGESIQSNAKSLQMGEPILLNPNSYDNIKEILESLKVNLGIGACKPLDCKKSRVLSLGYSSPWSLSFIYESAEVFVQGMKYFQRIFIFFECLFNYRERNLSIIKFTV